MSDEISLSDGVSGSTSLTDEVFERNHTRSLSLVMWSSPTTEEHLRVLTELSSESRPEKWAMARRSQSRRQQQG